MMIDVAARSVDSEKDAKRKRQTEEDEKRVLNYLQ
jgi:hypothetical protein